MASELGVARGRGRHREVDLRALRRRLGRERALAEVYVGHLAHLLPVRSIVVLRCRPTVLARRLDRARRGSAAERRANVVAEALDLVLVEALARSVPVWEIDTTRRSSRSVADEVLRRLRRPSPSRFGKVRWLEDRRVTDYLLRPPT